MPNERLRCPDVFDDPNLHGMMTCTIELKEVLCGTELRVAQEDVPGSDPRWDVLHGLAGESRSACTVGGA